MEKNKRYGKLIAKSLSMLPVALKQSVHSILMISMVVGGHLPAAAWAYDIASKNVAVAPEVDPTLGVGGINASIESSPHVALEVDPQPDNEDIFRLLNQDLPKKPQSGIDHTQTIAAFYEISSQAPSRFNMAAEQTMLNHFSAAEKPSVLDLGNTCTRVALQAPNQTVPFLEFYTDASKREIVTQAIQLKGVFYFITKTRDADGAVLDTKLNMIDLKRYKGVLGQARVPVFQAIVDVNSKITFDGQNLLVNDRPYESAVLQQYRDAQEVVFNITANLLDPQTYEAARSTAENLETFFSRSDAIQSLQGNANVTSPAAMQARLQEYLNGQITKLNPQIAKAESSAKEQNHTPSKGDMGVDQIEKFIADTAAAKVKFTSMKARMRLLNEFLQKPRYFGSRLYIKALENMAQAHRLSPDAEARLSEAKRSGRLTRVLANPKFDLMVAATGTVTLAALFPVEAHAILIQAQDLGWECAHWAKGLFDLTAESLKQSTASIFNYHEVIYNKLLAVGQRHKLGTALFGMFASLAAIAASTHFGVNFVKITREYRAFKTAETKAGRAPQKFKDFLIQRQREKETTYISGLATNSEESVSNKTWTTEEDAEAKALVTSLKEKDATWLGKLTKKVLPKKNQDEAVVNKDAPKAHSIISFGDALKHSMFSMAGYTDSQTSLMKAYNTLFYWRSYLRYPGMDWLALRYPDATQVMMSRDNQIVMPTKANGGLKTRSERRQWRREGFDIEELKIWETKIVDVERTIEAKALQMSLQKLTDFIDSSDELRDFFSDGGIRGITDSNISKLPPEARAYFMNYYEVASSEMMLEFLRDLISRNDAAESKAESQNTKSPEEMTLHELKAATLKRVEELKIESADANRYFAQVEKRMDIDATVDARIKANNAPWVEKYRWIAARRLDPSISRQANRIHSVRRLSAKPEYVIRAVRNAIAELIVDKPLETIQMFIFTAGVSSGINALFTNEAFGENSIFYMSRFGFLYGYVWSTFFSIMASSAMKLQIDEKNDGNFDHMPKGKELNQSYWRWYTKFILPGGKGPDGKGNPNKYWSTHWHIVNKMIIPNIPAYLTIIIPVELIFLGRIEMDVLVVGYMLSIMAGTSTYDMYLDQGFEMSLGHTVKDIPERLRNHPLVLTYVSAKQRMLRLKVNFFTKSVQNFVSFFTNTLITISAASGATRGFTRAFFGGYTPTELIVNPTRMLLNATQGIPVIEHIGAVPNKICEFLLLKGYDGTGLIHKK